MCRMLVVRGETAVLDVVDAAVAMSTGQTAAHERFEDDGRPWDHLDGWGLLARDAHGWRCARGVDPMSAAAAAALEMPHSPLTIAHVRKASDPRYLGRAYSHPVELERHGRPCYFFHNGYAPDVGALIGKSEGWDSERLLEYLLPVLGSALGPDITPLRAKLETLPSTSTAANFIFVEGDEVTVGNWYPADTDSPAYYTMRYAIAGERLIIASEALPSLAHGVQFQPCRRGALARFTDATPIAAIVAALQA